MAKRVMPAWTSTGLVVAFLALLAAGAILNGAERGPSMLIASAEEAAQADGLIAECRYDDAEHWIKEASKAARGVRSDSQLERDVAGIAVGQMAVKLDTFQRQRKAWDRAAKQVRSLLAENLPEAARRVLDQAAPPLCDSRFTEFRAEISRRTGQAAAWVSKGDQQAVRFPKTARGYYIQAQSIDPDWPGLQEKLLDVEKRIPGFCADCAPRR